MWTSLIIGILVSAGWLWYGLKREAELKADYEQRIVLLKEQNRQLMNAVDVMVDATDTLRAGYETSAKDATRLRRELARVKQIDGISRDYLNAPVPDRVRDVLKNSSCLQVPGSCKPDGSYGSGVPGDSND